MAKGTSKAPEGFYSPGEAMARFGIKDRDFFRNVVRKAEASGRLTPIQPGSYWMYPRQQIDLLADEYALIVLGALAERREERRFRAATSADCPGMVNVLRSYGWRTVEPAKRAAWYTANPHLDWVVEQNGIIVGYVNMLPLRPALMEGMMSGRKRAWDITPADILPYAPGHEHEVFVGLATHKQAPERAEVGRSLILGMFGSGGVLEQWKRAGMLIRRMYATSAEPDGQAVARLLDFEAQPTRWGDVVANWRYVLDLRTSQGHFARKYRAVSPQDTAEEEPHEDARAFNE